MDGRRMGVIEDLGGPRLRLRYDEAWYSDRLAPPLSLSMPLVSPEHGHTVVEPFLQGLLPDNDAVLRRWGRDHHVSHRNAFALLTHVGEDCAGVVQFVREERLEAVLSDAWDVEWIDTKEVEARLFALSKDASSWHARTTNGQFSLAGAQPKTAFLLDGDRWGVPSGRAPTTHILKPPIPGLDGHVENEHLCLRLAGELGLPVADSRVQRFGNQIAIVVARYDRAFVSEIPEHESGAELTSPIVRLHQEDICQALGVSPTSKYQNEGGPSPEDVVELLRRHSSNPTEDIDTFIDALILNWLIAGTDAHAKNYSILLGGGGRVRLAPLYDLASTLPYDDLHPRTVKSAMKIGGKYRVHEIGARQWRKLGSAIRVGSDRVALRAEELSEQVGDAMEAVRAEAHDSGLAHPIVDRLADDVGRRASDCLRLLRVGTEPQ